MFKKLDMWVIMALDPDLLLEDEGALVEGTRYSSPEAFVNDMPRNLKPDLSARRKVKLPTRLIAAVKSLTQLQNSSGLRGYGKAISNLAHYGFVKLLKDAPWRQIYRLNRALAMATPAIEEVFGISALDIMFTPLVQYSEPSRSSSVIPYRYESENTVMNNLDTMMAVFGQLLPLDHIVTWAVARAMQDSTVAMRYGLDVSPSKLARTMKEQVKENLRKKAALLKLMSFNDDFQDIINSTDGGENFWNYLRGLEI